ncbi:MAG: beta strand repeat-containing protein, partial [Pyrinomonadaceae bacterium]
TVISNTATATYSDGTNSYSATSNTVTVTVANVSGLTITPDAATNSAVVPGQTNVDFSFTVTNTGNFSDQVRFLASGASVTLNDNTLGTIQAAVIDNGDNVIGAGDTDIWGNGADVLKALAKNASATVIVRVNVSASAPAGQTLTVYLGDAATGGPSFDNQAADTSAHEVRTVTNTPTSVNGLREARGDISVAVQNDVQLRAVLNPVPGPVALGSNITYTMSLCNDGVRAATGMSLGGNSGVYIVAPVPANTVLSAANTFPAGTLYTTSALTTAPESASWVTSAPSPLSSTTRVAFKVGNALAGGGTCSGNFNLIVTITATDATTPIYEIVDSFATNTVNAVVSDQSGDNSTNTGDRNADFDEPTVGQPGVLGKGFKIQTLLQQTGGVLLGPSGAPAATGPGGDNNLDFTNRSSRLGINHAPGGTTDVQDTVTFTNTVQNTGNAGDTFTLTAPTVPAGFTVEISTNGGTSWTTVSGGGSTTLAVSFGASANFLVRVTVPVGQTVLTGFSTTIRATSGIDNTKRNDTIDRVYTGFVRLDKSFTISNTTGVGAATDPVPGADIVYTITYTNIMTAANAGGGAGNSTLAASTLVITEDGASGGNNWGLALPNRYTDQVVGSASDSNGGSITGDTANSTVLTDTIASLPAGTNGTFTFKRRIR